MLKMTTWCAAFSLDMTQDQSNSGTQTVAHFDVRFRRYLADDGQVVCTPLPAWADDPKVMLALYRTMIQTRVFDRRALNLQRTGSLGTYASPLGQEAIGAAVASVMAAEDVLLPSYREYSAQIWRGVTMTELLLYWGGDERGSDFQSAREDFPVCVPIASHAPHAVGVAYAFKCRQQQRVAVCFLGDGATSKGDFYEALNAAGAWQVPVVFVVSNNQWAISVPLRKQTAAQTLAQKAIAAGVANEQVDGNDVIAVRAAAETAITKARAGEGPCLLEALTYRMADHTTADDASRYRDQAEVDAYRARDPIDRLRSYLIARAWWSEGDERELQEQCKREVDDAVDKYLATAVQPAHAMFDFLYEALPASLQDQLEEVAGGAARD